jgi:hypothetical protein
MKDRQLVSPYTPKAYALTFAFREWIKNYQFLSFPKNAISFSTGCKIEIILKQKRTIFEMWIKVFLGFYSPQIKGQINLLKNSSYIKK